MGVDFSTLEPGRVTVVESPRRLKPFGTYGTIRALWWLWLADGRSAASVPPGAHQPVSKILKEARCDDAVHDLAFTADLRAAANESLNKAGLQEVDRAFKDLYFACNGLLLQPHHRSDCRHLVDESIPPADGLRLPTHCFPDGIAYGIVADGKVVSVAWSRCHDFMEEEIADIGVETAPPYRKRGYAKTVVSAVVEHITRKGGEAFYGCDPDNHASVATARSVGFVPYGRGLVLSAPANDPES